MRKLFSLIAAAALTLLCVAVLVRGFGGAPLKVEHPWSPPSMAAHVPGAVYFTIINNGAEGDRLVAVKTDLAEAAEIHRSVTDADGLARMEFMKNGVEAPAKSMVSFETGAYHIMLIGLDHKLAVGESYPLTLVFEKAGEVQVTVKVEERMTMPAEHRH